MAPVETTQIEQYLPVLMLGALAVLFTGGMLVGSVLLGKSARTNKVKDTAYECGMIPIGAGNTRLSVKFYLVAMLFILFDVEVVFLYPWAVVYKDMLRDNAGLILGAMLSFTEWAELRGVTRRVADEKKRGVERRILRGLGGFDNSAEHRPAFRAI